MIAVAAMAMAGCGSGSDDAADPGGSTTTSEAPADPATAPTGTAEPGTDADQVSGSKGFSDGVDELRDGVWQVGGAGEVEFTLVDGRLSLGGVRASEGWGHRISDEQADEISVHFTRGTSAWKFEVEIDDSTMEISKELTLTSAVSGTYGVGSAAQVTFDGDGSGITAGEVTPRPGWNVTSRDEGGSNIEIGFRNESGGKAEFEVETDRGDVEVEINQKLAGPLPA